MTVEGKYRISGQKGKQYYRVKIGNVVGNINRFSGKLVLVESDIASDLQTSKYLTKTLKIVLRVVLIIIFLTHY